MKLNSFKHESKIHTMKSNNFKHQSIKWFIIFIILMSFVSADEIIMSVNQSEYYFLVGQDAFVPIEIENTYSFLKQGFFTYSITQNINQQGTQYSSSNSETKSYAIQTGESNLTIGLGKSNGPGNMTLELSFDFDDKSVELNPINVFFVENQDEKQQNSQKQEASSKETMTEKLQNMFNKEEEEKKEPTTSDKLQNKQMSQDSNALKQQMQKDIEKKKQAQQEFQKNLEQNKDFQKMNKQLLNESYKLDSGEIDATDNNSGSFELNYKREDGEEAKLSGNMKNNSMENMNIEKTEGKKEMVDKLRNDERFKDIEKKLNELGFNESNIDFYNKDHFSQLNMTFSKDNLTKIVEADFNNKNLTDVRFEEEENYWWMWLLLLIPLVGLLLFKKNEPNLNKNNEKLFDYKAESLLLLDRSIKYFDKKQYKDAYSLAAQSLRLFLAYKDGLNKEMTNLNMVKYMKSKKLSYKDIQECFNLCTLVEFAKYQANKTDFDRIIKLATKTIQKKF